MNDVFSWGRFCKVVRMDVRRMLSTQGNSLLTMGLSMSFVTMVTRLMSNAESATFPNDRLIEEMLFLAAWISFVPYTLYLNINQPKKGRFFAMLPASHLEKLLSMIVLTLVVFPILIVVTYAIGDTLFAVLPFTTYEGFIWQIDGSDSFMTWFPLLLSCGFAYGATEILANVLFVKHKAAWALLFTFAFCGIMLASFFLLFVFDESGLDDFIRTVPNYAGLVGIICFAYSLIVFWLTYRKMKRTTY